MIHRDLCDPKNTKDYSPLRMQFHFLLSRFSCWDGLISITKSEMADLLECDMQSINKFIKKGMKEHILSFEGNRLFLLKRVNQFSDGYVKHFPFLESVEFKTLNVHTQRFILYTLWAGVHTNRPLKREISSLYHSGKELTGVLNLYSKAPIYSILEEAKKFLKIELTTKNNKEMVRVLGLHEPFIAEQALENKGETQLLLNMLDEYFCDTPLSKISFQEILKIKKHYFTKLQSIGMELFSCALKKLFSLHKLYDLDNRGEIGRYLKSILKDMEQKLVSTLQKRVEYTENSIFHTRKLGIPMASKIISYFQSKLTQLTKTLKMLQPNNHSDIQFSFYNWLEVPNN